MQESQNTQPKRRSIGHVNVPFELVVVTVQVHTFLMVTYFISMLFYFTVDSASEQGGSENDTDDSDSRDLTGYACRHCFTTSKFSILLIQFTPYRFTTSKWIFWLYIMGVQFNFYQNIAEICLLFPNKVMGTAIHFILYAQHLTKFANWNES